MHVNQGLTWILYSGLVYEYKGDSEIGPSQKGKTRKLKVRQFKPSESSRQRTHELQKRTFPCFVSMATRKEVRFRVNLHLLCVAGICCEKKGRNMPQEVHTQCYRTKKDSEGGKCRASLSATRRSYLSLSNTSPRGMGHVVT